MINDDDDIDFTHIAASNAASNDVTT